MKKFYQYFIFLLLLLFFIVNQLQNKNVSTIEITVSDSLKDSLANFKGLTYNNFITSYKDENYFKAILYEGDINVLDSLKIKIGLKEFNYSRNDLKKISTVNILGKNYYNVTKDVKIRKPLIPFLNKIINFKTNIKFFANLILQPHIALLIFCFIFFRKYNLNKLVENASNNKITDKIKFQFPLVIFCFLMCFLLIVYNNAYYFLQDDNYIQFTPIIVQSLNDFYENGTMPIYNFYQNSGIPTLNYNIYSLNYLFTHVAFIISKYILHNSLHFNSVFAFIHFFLGYVFLYKLLRLLKINFIVALVSSLSFIFCGFNLETTRSWYYLAPSIAFGPLLGYYRLLWSPNFTVKRAILYGVLIAIYAYSGNIQYFSYSIFLWIILEILAYSKTRNKKIIIFISLSFSISLLLFLPQLITTLKEIKYLYRIGGVGMNIAGHLNEFLTPLPSKTNLGEHFSAIGYEKYNWTFFKCSFLSAIASFIALYYYLFTRTGKRNNYLFYLLIVLLFCILYGSGNFGVIYKLLRYLPFWDKFSHTFKIMLYINLLFIICGAIIINKIKNSIIIYVLMGVQLFALFFQIINSKTAFFIYNYDKPYKALSYKNVLDTTLDYRVLPVSVLRTTNNDFNESLMHNLATFYKIPSLEVMEDLSPNKIDIDKNLSEFSVRYIIYYNKKANDDFWEKPNINKKVLQSKYVFDSIFSNESVTIYENKNYMPIVSLYDKENKLIIKNKPKIIYECNKVSILYNEIIHPQMICLSFNYRDKLEIKLNDFIAPKFKDSLNRIIIYPKNTFNRITISNH